MCRKLNECLDDIKKSGLKLGEQIGTAKICFAEDHDYYWVGVFNSANEKCRAIDRNNIFPIVDPDTQTIVAVMLSDGVSGKEKLEPQKEYYVYSLK